MQFRDLQRQYEALKAQMDKAVLDAVAQSHFIMGPQVRELEARLAEYVGVRHCISCANGTDALDIALKIWGIGPGDAVFVPDFTFFSTAEVVALEGAEPVFVDVCGSSFNMDPDDLERAIAEVRSEGRLRPAAVIAVDLFGLPAEYGRICAICDRYGLKLLEDGAQGFGGAISGKKSGGKNEDASCGIDVVPAGRACSFGDISTTSFFPAKPLGCYGDGGAIFTDNDEWAALADSIRVHGKGSMKYDNVRLGLNSRLDTVQAAVLQVKLDAFPEELIRVNEVAALYAEELAGVARGFGADDLLLPQVPEGYLSSWAQYTIRTSRRDELQQFLKDRGIPAMIYYIKPLSAQKAFEGLRTLETGVADMRAPEAIAAGLRATEAIAAGLRGAETIAAGLKTPEAIAAGLRATEAGKADLRGADCPAADGESKFAVVDGRNLAAGCAAGSCVRTRQCPTAARLCGEVLSLPMYPYMTPDEVREVCGAIKEFFG